MHIWLEIESDYISTKVKKNGCSQIPQKKGRKKSDKYILPAKPF